MTTILELGTINHQEVGRVWHDKNIQRISVPDIDRSFFVQAPGEGEIDYRWAMAKVLASDFNGYISIEGAGPSDVPILQAQLPAGRVAGRMMRFECVVSPAARVSAV